MATEQIFNIKDKIDEDKSIESFQYHKYEPETGIDLNQQGEMYIYINHPSKYYYAAKAYLTIEGQLQKADGSVYGVVDVVTLQHNVIPYLFSNISFSLGGKQIENLNHPGQASTLFGMLTLPDDFSRAGGMNMCWYKDSSATASLTENTGFKVRHDVLFSSDPKGTFSFSLSLSELLGFCNDFTKILYGFDMQLVLNRQSDNDAIFRNAAAGAGKINLTKCALYMPIVKPSDMERLALAKIIENKDVLDVGYRMRECSTITVEQDSHFTWKLSNKSSPERPRWLILAFQTNKRNNQLTNASVFDHINLTNAYVLLNDVRFPAIDYHINMDKMQFSRMFKEVCEFRENFYGMDKLISNGGINFSDYKTLYPIYIFDVSKQPDVLKYGTTNIVIECQFSENVPANTRAYCLCISDRELKFKADGTQMSIVS